MPTVWKLDLGMVNGTVGHCYSQLLDRIEEMDLFSKPCKQCGDARSKNDWISQDEAASSLLWRLSSQRVNNAVYGIRLCINVWCKRKIQHLNPCTGKGQILKWDDVVFQDRRKNNISIGSWKIQEIKLGLCRRVKQESIFFCKNMC